MHPRVIQVLGLVDSNTKREKKNTKRKKEGKKEE
jgi:hypothetical protein